MEQINDYSQTNTAYDFILYHEGGDNYRPLIVVHLRENMWSTPNICFYKSSGKSNDRQAGKYAGTWFPIAGLTNSADELPGIGKGHLIKMSDLYKEVLPWVYKRITDYFIQKHNIDLSGVIKKLQYRENISKTEMERYKKMFALYDEIYDFIRSYFCFEWQLKISAIFSNGGENGKQDGYWKKNPSFYDYIISTVRFSPKIQLLQIPEDVHYSSNKQSKHLTQQKQNIFTDSDMIIDVLIENQAQIENIEEATDFLGEHLRENNSVIKISLLNGFQTILGEYNRTMEATNKYKMTKTLKKTTKSTNKSTTTKTSNNSTSKSTYLFRKPSPKTKKKAFTLKK